MAGCVYCDKGDALSGVYKVCDLKASTVYIFREQTHRGRCVVAELDHHRELFELSDEERNAYMSDVAAVAKAINDVYSPDKINYGAFSDTMGHIHFHLVPKYKDEDEWGGTFVINLNKKFLTDEEYAEMAQKLNDALKDYKSK